MNDFTFQCPTRFVFGRQALDQVGDTLAERGFSHALVVYGRGSAERSGILDRMRAQLASAGIVVTEQGGARPNPEVAFVREGIRVAREAKIDVVLAVGGGSVIDAAKAIAFGVPYEGDVWDFFCKKAQIGSALPVAAVLTIPAAGSEASDSCVISNDELGAKNGVNCALFRPFVAFMDPQVTFSLPPYQTAAGVTDMIAHICERFFSGVGAVPVTDNIACGLIRALMDETPRALANPDDYDARANIMWAGMLAHNGLAGCGRALACGQRAGGWESHALEHALSAFDTTITHGAGLAVMMPAWMRYVWRDDPDRFLLFAREVFDIEPVQEGDEGFVSETQAVEDAVEACIDLLASFFASMGMPVRLGGFGLSEECVDDLTAKVIAAKGEPFGAFKRLDSDDVRAIYRSAF
ncbi:iron-containing alcohol dehydrogenase [Slackia exigua]|uniref:iron-containing alcohol dehydrogenase n=1 Tax=Slackia exigua TaxID=84109 RepID=UPI0020069438|nr:iron-containing alcohol dehydrogenase [Slackia exigua]MCK6138772.1 iron-containing alcohol dehydrogenase [Slackia exigua]